MDELHRKYRKLKNILADMGSAAIAFSGGVDSTFLLETAHSVLRERTAAVMIRAPWFPKREIEEAEQFCEMRGIRLISAAVSERDIPGFSGNPPDRCYLCKREMFLKMQNAAEPCGFSYIAEGSNLDDLSDYRPGLKALAELGIRSPLREAELTKAEIRALSKELGLPTWDKPGFACLASRFVYGEMITAEKLSMVGAAEQLLLDLGFRQMRVRIHGESLARIEVLPEDIPKLVQKRAQIVPVFKNIGFTYVSADLSGYRTGSMNDIFTKG